jgi:hypothetical protein
MLSPPFPMVMPSDWFDLIGTAWSLGSHPIAVKN